MNRVNLITIGGVLVIGAGCGPGSEWHEQVATQCDPTNYLCCDWALLR